MVFISYSHDSPQHSETVRNLADRLRNDGVDAELDQYHASPRGGWPLWMHRCLAEAEYVLVVCSNGYHQKVMHLEVTKGKGKGVKWESLLTLNELYQSEGLSDKFIPIVFHRSQSEFIPSPISGHTFYSLPEEYPKLFQRISSQTSELKPPLGFQSNDATDQSLSSVSTKIATESVDIDIVLNEDFDQFSVEKKNALLKAIETLLGADHEIRLKRMRRGSVVLTLGLPAHLAERLFWAANAGELSGLNVVKASMVEERAEDTRSTPVKDSYRQILERKGTSYFDLLAEYTFDRMGTDERVWEFDDLAEDIYESWPVWLSKPNQQLCRTRVFKCLQKLVQQGRVRNLSDLYQRFSAK